jgi:hypothetical protein
VAVIVGGHAAHPWASVPLIPAESFLSMNQPEHHQQNEKTNAKRGLFEMLK